MSQNDVAASTELTKMAVSRAMRALERLGLVDRGPDFLYYAVRVILTKRGTKVLEQGRALIAGVT